MNKRLNLIVVFIIVSFLFSPLTISAGSKKAYGVFIGLNPDKITSLFQYEEVVIDAAYYSKKDIELLHKNNVRVYSYLNIGSLENFRTYYDDFKDITLGEYENWPDERWADVSNRKWQEQIVDKLAKELSDKGVDGFFLDNADVYGIYTQDGIFEGLINIIEGLKKEYNKKILINGGYDFFKKALEKGIDLRSIVDGANRESVLTDVDFEKGSFVLRTPEEANWAMDSLNEVSRQVNNIYVIEYSKNTRNNSKILLEYSKTNYEVYISNSIGLD